MPNALRNPPGTATDKESARRRRPIDHASDVKNARVLQLIFHRLCARTACLPMASSPDANLDASCTASCSVDGGSSSDRLPARLARGHATGDGFVVGRRRGSELLQARRRQLTRLTSMVSSRTRWRRIGGSSNRYWESENSSVWLHGGGLVERWFIDVRLIQGEIVRRDQSRLVVQEQSTSYSSGMMPGCRSTGLAWDGSILALGIGTAARRTQHAANADICQMQRVQQAADHARALCNRTQTERFCCIYLHLPGQGDYAEKLTGTLDKTIAVSDTEQGRTGIVRAVRSEPRKGEERNHNTNQILPLA